MARRLRLAPKRRVIVRFVRNRVVLQEQNAGQYIINENDDHLTFEDGNRIKKEEAD